MPPLENTSNILWSSPELKRHRKCLRFLGNSWELISRIHPPDTLAIWKVRWERGI